MNVTPIVLIVGADAETRLLYRLFLEFWEFQAVEAADFEEVLSAAEYLEPQLILMDGERLPENDLETIRKIRASVSLQDVPLVLASGHCQAKVRQRMLSGRADDFLIKPLDFDELRSSLQTCMGKSRYSS